MNSFKRVVNELSTEQKTTDKPTSSDKETWLSSRCTNALIIDLTAKYLDALSELPCLSTATSEGREESDMLKGQIQLLESILNDVTEIPEDEE